MEEQLIEFETGKLILEHNIPLSSDWWFDNGKLSVGSCSGYGYQQKEKGLMVPCCTQSALQTYLRNKKKILVEVRPVDSWFCWQVTLWGEDIMNPFYQIPIEYFEFHTYEEALEYGLKEALTTF